MRVFKNTWFQKFARKEDISDSALCEAVMRAERGLIDADLGGGVIKQRVARAGAGRSGGYRTLLLFQLGTRSVFVSGFAKNDRENVDAIEERNIKRAAKMILALTESDMDRLVDMEELEEIFCNG